MNVRITAALAFIFCTHICFLALAEDTMSLEIRLAFVSDIKATDLYIRNMTATRSGKEIDFIIEYESGAARGCTLFNPPEGDFISVKARMAAGKGVVKLRTDLDILSRCKDITINFYRVNLPTDSIFLKQGEIGKILSGKTDLEKTLNSLVAKIDINSSTPDDIRAVFGEPLKYAWQSAEFEKASLPSTYIMFYTNGFSVWIMGNRIEELRFTADNYTFRDSIRVGMTIDAVLGILGQPTNVVRKKANQFQDGILYMDINGNEGYCYYARNDLGIRMFFEKNSLSALFLFKPVKVVPKVSFNPLVAKLNMDKATPNDIRTVFGEPVRYYWGATDLKKDNLPSVYLMSYSSTFDVLISGNKVEELRFMDDSYIFHDSIHVGLRLDEVLGFLGQPSNVVQKKANQFQDGILYMDIDGNEGYCYYARNDLGIRMFFSNYILSSLYLFKPANIEPKKTLNPLIDKITSPNTKNGQNKNTRILRNDPSNQNGATPAYLVFDIGSTRQELFDTLGNPDLVFYGSTQYVPGVDINADAYHVYRNIGLSFWIVGNYIKEITLLNSNWKISDGLAVGMTKTQMVDILGTEYKAQIFRTKGIYAYSKYSISVEVDNTSDRITEINVQ